MSLPGLSALIWHLSLGIKVAGVQEKQAWGRDTRPRSEWSCCGQRLHLTGHLKSSLHLFLCREKWEAHEGSIGQICTIKRVLLMLCGEQTSCWEERETGSWESI